MTGAESPGDAPVGAPANAKGTNLIPAVKFLRSRKDEARAALPPELHHYLDRRVLPGSWYPEDHLMVMMRVLVSLMDEKPEEAWALAGAQAANAHAKGAYEGVFRLGPKRLLESLDAFWRLQHDTGTWEVRFLGDGIAEVRLQDFAVGMPEYGLLLTGYLRRVLALAGVADAACLLLGSDRSSGLWRLSWQA